VRRARRADSSLRPAFERLEPRVLLDAVKDPYLQAALADSVWVLVEADDAQAPATVEYGLTSGYGMEAITESTEATDRGYHVHNVKLTGLEPNTQYHYRVTHGATTSADRTFWTAVEPGTAFRFGYMSDSQAGRGIHAQCATLMASLNPRMITFGGDASDDPTWESWDEDFFVPEQEALNAEVPFVNAPGNHEGWTALTRAYTQGPEGDGEGYFSFDYGDAHFLVLNTQIDRKHSSDQWAFAAADLAATTQPWKIVVFHKSGYVSGGHGEDLDMRLMSDQVFVPNEVDLTLSGHNHFYQHNEAGGIHHVVIGSTGGTLYGPSAAAYTLYTEKTHCIGVFDVTATTLKMTTYRQDGTVIETLHLDEDRTPPTAPTGLSTRPIGTRQIDLRWQAASDPERGIDHYNVYRDGQWIASVEGTDYSDTPLADGTTYTYEVSAVNGDLVEGPRSAAATRATPADTDAPEVCSVSAANANRVLVVYGEPVEPASAEDAANYGIDQDVSVVSATLQPNGATVSLAVSALSEGTTYTLTIEGVRDRATVPNAIAPEIQRSFEHVGWRGQDVGEPGMAGSGDYDDATGVHTIAGGGGGIWASPDEFHYVYSPLAGNGEITARVVSVGNTNPAAEAGVMIRETLAADSPHATVGVTPGGSICFDRRLTAGGPNLHKTTFGPGGTYWVRLVRKRDSVTAWWSLDGMAWSQGGSATIVMADDVTVGLAVTSHSDAALCTAELDNATVVEWGVNAPANAAGDVYGVDEDGMLVVDAAAGVLANDADAEADVLSVRLVRRPLRGALRLKSDGAFAYEPDAAFFGMDSFSYVVDDGWGPGGNVATVLLAVNALPDPPVAAGDAYDAGQDMTLAVDASCGLLANDVDADGDALTAELVSDVSEGTLNLNADGTFDYTPRDGYMGPDGFSYRTYDGEMYSEVAAVEIAVGEQWWAFYAAGEVAVSGEIAGSYLDTHACDNVYEALTEAPDAGGAALEHLWAFQLTEGTAFRFHVDAWRNGTLEAFQFSYYTDGLGWTDIVLVTQTHDDHAPQTYDLLDGLAGFVLVRVVDTDRTASDDALDTLRVDEMFILAR